ncbi:hypothetical protein B566_EDAN010155, partial [Ephemera danica]
EEDGSEEETRKLVERRKGYIRRTSSVAFNTTRRQAFRRNSGQPQRLFHALVLLLEEVESRHGQSESSRLTFLSQLHACPLPTPGQSLMLPGLVISRPPDPRLEETELAQAFDCLHHSLLIKLLASLLHERNKVTSCVMALQSALYPFSWQHTLVSALPSSMLGVCDAPTPYLLGGMVVDLDQGRVLYCMDDEEKILPAKLRKALRLALQLVESSTRPNEPPRNVLVSEAFVRTFVEVCGHYRTHIVTQQDGKRVFERESFVKGAYPRCIQSFLEWFTETAMFSHFIESRLQSATQGIFERRCCERMQEMEKSTLMFLKNYKVVSRKGKTFGDRIKDWSSNF